MGICVQILIEKQPKYSEFRCKSIVSPKDYRLGCNFNNIKTGCPNITAIMNGAVIVDIWYENKKVINEMKSNK